MLAVLTLDRVCLGLVPFLHPLRSTGSQNPSKCRDVTPLHLSSSGSVVSVIVFRELGVSLVRRSAMPGGPTFLDDFPPLPAFLFALHPQEVYSLLTCLANQQEKEDPSGASFHASSCFLFFFGMSCPALPMQVLCNCSASLKKEQKQQSGQVGTATKIGTSHVVPVLPLILFKLLCSSHSKVHPIGEVTTTNASLHIVPSLFDRVIQHGAFRIIHTTSIYSPTLLVSFLFCLRDYCMVYFSFLLLSLQSSFSKNLVNQLFSPP